MNIIDKIRKRADNMREKKIIVGTCLFCPYIIKKEVEGRGVNFCSISQKVIRGYDYIFVPNWCELSDNDDCED